MKVSIVILSWNAENLLQQFLPSVVQNSTANDVEVVVADNGSTDGTLALLASQFPSVRVISFDWNYGFAEGYNRALAQVDAEYAVLLNDDVEVSPNWLEPLISFMDAHPDHAACQPKLLSWHQPDHFEYAGACGGYLDRYGYPFCRGRIFNTIEVDRGQYDDLNSESTSLLWATGACLFVRMNDFRASGGLDGRFFAHMEEVDFCWRLRCRGRRIACISESVVRHVGGASLQAGSPRKTFLNFRNNLLMLYKNLPENELHHVMRMRAMLDVMAAFMFLLKGEGRNFLAVFRARRAYRHLRSSFFASRSDNIKAAAATGNPLLEVSERKRFSILFHYHLLRQHTFDRLPM